MRNTWRAGLWVGMAVCLATGVWGQADVEGMPPPKVAEARVSAAAEAAVAEDAGGRVVFWNVRWFPGGNPKAGPEAQKKQMAGVREKVAVLRPDLWFGCEVRDLESWKSLRLDLPWRACTDIPRTEDEGADLPQQGMAVAGRRPWKDLWVLDFSGLPATPDRPHRGVLAVQYERKDGALLTCYVVHLKSNRGGIAGTSLQRARTVDYLRWDWARKGLDPRRDALLLIGDFNTSGTDLQFRGDPTLGRLEALGFVDAATGLPREKRLTIGGGGGFPPNDFDHALLSPPLAASLGRDPPWMTVYDLNESLSDHAPIGIDFTPWFRAGKN